MFADIKGMTRGCQGALHLSDGPLTVIILRARGDKGTLGDVSTVRWFVKGDNYNSKGSKSGINVSAKRDLRIPC